MNKVVLIGRLTKDPETRITTGDISITTFTLAVNRTFAKDEADFIRVTAWRKTAELCAQYLSKGRQVAIEGRIQVRSYDDKTGKTVWVTEVIADTVEFLGNSNTGGNTNSKKEDAFNYNTPKDVSKEELLAEIDDVPF